MKIKLVEKRDEARGTKSFFWQAEAEVKFLPGQYFYYTLPKLNYPDPRGTTRHFTIASSPTENPILRLTTRIREESGYKKTLDELPIGTEIVGEGPAGTFIFDPKEKGPHVFIAGGIGITPFRCFIKYAIDNKLTTPLFLIFSNSDSEFVYKNELDKWQAENDFLKISYLDSSKVGHLDAAKIEKIIGNWPPALEGQRPGGKLQIGNFTLWLVGPPPFIDAIEVAAGKLKISSAHLRTEKFTGY